MSTNILSKFQEQFWLLNMLAPKSSAYNIPSVFKLDFLPDLNLLEKSVNMLVDRHQALRTQFSVVDFSLQQEVLSSENVSVKINIIQLNSIENVNEMPDEIIQEVNNPFELDKAPLIRVCIFKNLKSIYLTIVFHHIIVDFHSKEVFQAEISYIYNSLKQNKKIELLPVNNTYVDFTNWHNEFLNSEISSKMLSDWSKELPKANTLINLPIDKARLKYSALNGKRKYFELSSSLSSAIVKFADANATNPFSVLLTAYTILLHRLSQQDTVVLGVPLSNRREEKFKDTFGAFVNALPISVELTNNYTFFDVHKQIRHKLLLAHRKQEIPFVNLVGLNKEVRDSSFNPFFQTGFTFEHPMKLQLDGIEEKSIPVERAGAQLDQFVTMWQDDNIFSGFWEYSTDLFDFETSERLISSFLKLLTDIFIETKSLESVSILPESDKNKIIQWNSTDFPVDSNICLHQKFEQKVKSHPHLIALKYGGNELSYKELNLHVNRLSNFLISKGVLVQDKIAFSLYRSVEMIIAIFAIHKAGACYLPIDPNTPKERIDSVLEDAKPKFIISMKKSSDNFIDFDNNILIDNIVTIPLSEDESNPEVDVKSSDLAYILYTSGSTGKPKGVMIEHHSVINKIEWMQYKYPLTENDCMILKTPVTFDVSVWEIFWWFFSGSSLSILDVGGEKDPSTIIKTVEDHKVTTIIFVPSMFSSFVEYLHAKNTLSSIYTLKYIVQIGEALSSQLVMDFNKLRSALFSPLLINTYGPTEATVAVSYYDCPDAGLIDKIYIGKPIFNTKLFVIDKTKNVQPIGVAGELVIAGRNLSRGYLNRPELNEDRFITISFNNKEYKVYRTGDLVKWNNQGEIDFIGRVDNQVKIRGYRIELGDIEAKIMTIDSIHSTAVIAHKISETNKQLVAYYVVKEGENINVSQIKSILVEKLPDYMIPAHFVLLKEMPLNTSGKIDRKSLPEPVFEIFEEKIKPASEYEKQLSTIWSELLNIKDIGVTNNFFEVGGDSLSSIKLVSKIKNIIDVNIEPTILMQYPTIRELAKHISEIKSEVLEKNIDTPIVRKRDFRNNRK
ncbi:MAG: amino acid adenylation domain-containing protein [Bacteroidales bacterium]|nr:amino acid adenylation domain-containing protein [Bacteroidales bacterium]